jgi:DNA-binding CsgD family transcriptional regulator
LKANSLQQAIIESFVDGVLIVTEQGELVLANDYGRQICHQISTDSTQLNSVPQPIWYVCKTLNESYQLFPEQKLIIESEIEISPLARVRMRVRKLELDTSSQPYFLVTLENLYNSHANAAIMDAQQYGLTSREAEIWLLRRANYSYQQIADNLYITINTVKKHMKSIYRKLEN